MIFADSKFLGIVPPPLHNAKAIDGLVDSTGAHIVVSDKQFPPIGELVKKHAEGNSIFIYITEFPSRETEDALRTMIEHAVNIKHFVILGSIIDYGGDQAWYNNAYRSHYSHYINWLAHIASVGGFATSISPEYLDTYVSELEKNIDREMSFIPMSVRRYSYRTDSSLTLATVPAIGAAAARAIVNNYKKSGRSFNLIDAIAFYTNKKKCSTNAHTESMCAGTRKWFGVPDGWNITLEPEEEVEDDE